MGTTMVVVGISSSRVGNLCVVGIQQTLEAALGKADELLLMSCARDLSPHYS
jgi:hypothetical protein